MKRGIGVTDAIAIGKAYVLPEPDMEHLPARTDDAEGEVERLFAAVQASRMQLAAIAAQADNETANIMRAHITFLEDDSFNEHAAQMIRTQGYTAEKAIAVTAQRLGDMFRTMEDDYMRERASDISDVSGRVIRTLLGEPESPLGKLPPETIVVARDLVPSQTAQLNRENVAGFVTELGGKTSHTAIMAQAKGIAAVVACAGILAQVKTGDEVIVNALTGEVFVNPTQEELAQQRRRKETHERLGRLAETAKDWTLRKKDGGTILVAANIGNVEEAKQAKANGADGIGLFRSEFLFMNRRESPTEEEQFQVYRTAVDLFAPAPVVIRTLDVGGDKCLPYLDMPTEKNPFLGVRGIRLCLQHEDLFRIQLRALLRAGSYGNLKIMFPMISHMSELRRAKELLAQCQQELRDEGVDAAEVSVGMMIEVPAAAVCAEAFAKEVDFFSIGTNDLTQYTLAVDRGNAALNELCDYMHPAVLRLISQTIAAAHRVGISCGMCGEMAGDAAALELLSGYGLDTYSVSPGSIGRTKCGLLMQEQVCCSEADEGFLERLGR